MNVFFIDTFVNVIAASSAKLAWLAVQKAASKTTFSHITAVRFAGYCMYTKLFCIHICSCVIVFFKTCMEMHSDISAVIINSR